MFDFVSTISIVVESARSLCHQKWGKIMLHHTVISRSLTFVRINFWIRVQNFNSYFGRNSFVILLWFSSERVDELIIDFRTIYLLLARFHCLTFTICISALQIELWTEFEWEEIWCETGLFAARSSNKTHASLFILEAIQSKSNFKTFSMLQSHLNRAML